MSMKCNKCMQVEISYSVCSRLAGISEILSNTCLLWLFIAVVLLQLISDAGYQGEITSVSTACQQLEVFSRVLRTSLATILDGGEENLEKNLPEFAVSPLFLFMFQKVVFVPFQLGCTDHCGIVGYLGILWSHAESYKEELRMNSKVKNGLFCCQERFGLGVWRFLCLSNTLCKVCRSLWK